MYLLHIELRGLTASFRVPHMFKYHRSLPLPPYTTVVGMFGAAIGRDMATTQEIFKSSGLKVGITGTFKGGCNDTWRILTTKNPENDVVERQILYKPRYHIIFYGEIEAIKLCERAFLCPAYPLSLGRPDDLVNAIVHEPFNCNSEQLNELRNTVIVVDPAKGIPALKVSDSLFDIDDPLDHGPSTLLYRLPVHFDFTNGFSYERTADKHRDFFFIGEHTITLKEPVTGFKITDSSGDDKTILNVPLLEIWT